SNQTLLEHWNGSTWSLVSSPNPSTLYSAFSGIAAVSANDVWAVGLYADDSTGNDQALVAHWNGSNWSIVLSPNTGVYRIALYGVAAISANDVWAVGYYSNNGVYGGQTLVEHWNGSSWTIVPSPNPGRLNNFLNAVAAVSANDVW